MATSWEHFVNTVQNSSGNPQALYDYIQKSQDFLTRNVTNFDNVLQTLNVEHHSLAILAILVIKYTSPGAAALDVETLLIQIKDFLTTCNGEHVRFGSNLYADLCHCLTNSLVSAQQAIKGIPVLSYAIKKIQLSSSQLTSIHADLCQLCLSAKCFKPALEFLETDISDISKENGCYDVKYFLLYYYYGGMIYAALKQNERALYFYQVCITTPSSALSLIMLEAYKKHLLVSLVAHGKVLTLPKYTSRCVSKSFRQMVQPYHELSSAYETNDPDKVREIVEQHQELYNSEQNFGLVKQCLTSIYKKNIQRLTKTFLTLSLANIASRVKLASAAEAETYLLEMIADEEIYAKIDERDGMVEFYESPVKYDSISLVKHLDTQMQKYIDLDRKITKMDREISTNTEYIRRSVGASGGNTLSGIEEDTLVASTTGGTAAHHPSSSSTPTWTEPPSSTPPAPSTTTAVSPAAPSLSSPSTPTTTTTTINATSPSQPSPSSTSRMT